MRQECYCNCQDVMMFDVYKNIIFMFNIFLLTMRGAKIINVKPTVFWQSIFNKIFILVFIFAHINGVVSAASCKVVNHGCRLGVLRRFVEDDAYLFLTLLRSAQRL